MIDREHPLSMVRQVKLPEISCSAVYYRPRPTREADLALMRRIDELHLEHPFMSARMLCGACCSARAYAWGGVIWAR